MPSSHSASALNRPLTGRAILLLLLGLSAVAAAGILAGPRPLLALGFAAAVPLAIALVAWPNAATLAVIFILYSNAAVVAVKFHGLPFIVGALVPMLLAAPLIYYVVVRRQSLIVDRVLPLILLFLVIQLVAAIFSSDPDFSISKLLTFTTEGVCLYFLIINVVRTPEMLRRVTWVLLSVGAILGGLSAYQAVTKTYHANYGGFAQMSKGSFATGEPTVSGEARLQRLAGSLGEKNRYAQIMLMLIPLGMFRFWSERSAGLRIAALLATALAACGMALAFSRGAAVGFLLMLVIVVLLRYITLYQCGIMLAGLLLLLFAIPQYAHRLTSLANLSGALNAGRYGLEKADGAARSRYTETIAAWLMFADHPLIGVGPGMYPSHYREYAHRVTGAHVKQGKRKPHILYLGIAAELGTPGLIVYLLIMLTALGNLALARRRCRWTNPQDANMATGFMLALVAYMTTGLFLHFAYIRYFWLMLALAGVAARVADDGSAGPVQIRQERAPA